MVKLNIKLPDGFLEEEVRCGYLVTHEMKKAWAVMLDLLAEFDRVCKKYGLQYQGNGGTLLGAVRHKGFIPWDDDLDLQMLRHDYDVLCDVGPREFRYPYFFQSKLTDPGMNYFCSKLRNSLTTAYAPGEELNLVDYNKGIFIDIIPYDNVPDDAEQRSSFLSSVNKKKMDVIKKGRLIGVFSETNNKYRYMIKKSLSTILSIHKGKRLSSFLKEYQELEELCRKYDGISTKYISSLMFPQTEYTLYEYEDVSSSILMDFEFLKMPVAKNFDHLLTHLFGNYNEYIIQEGHSMVLNADIAYDVYNFNSSLL